MVGMESPYFSFLFFLSHPRLLSSFLLVFLIAPFWSEQSSHDPGTKCRLPRQQHSLGHYL